MPDANQDHHIDLVLALLGVIQGLAFARLAEKIPWPKDLKEFRGSWAALLHCFLGLMIVARIFQTYASAALAYKEQIGAVNYLSVFFVGLVEYWVLDVINKEKIDPTLLHTRVGVLSLITFVLYSGELYRQWHGGMDIRIQVVNCLFALFGIVVCTLSVQLRSNTGLQVFLSGLMALILAFNIHLSLTL